MEGIKIPLFEHYTLTDDNRIWSSKTRKFLVLSGNDDVTLSLNGFKYYFNIDEISKHVRCGTFEEWMIPQIEKTTSQTCYRKTPCDYCGSVVMRCKMSQHLKGSKRCLKIRGLFVEAFDDDEDYNKYDYDD